MAGPTIAERRGLAPREPQLDEAQRRAAVLEINEAVASRYGLDPEKRSGMWTGRDGFLFDGTKGPEHTKINFPGITADGRRFIIKTFYGGKTFNDPSFEVVYPAEFNNLGISTQNALDEAKRLLAPLDLSI